MAHNPAQASEGALQQSHLRGLPLEDRLEVALLREGRHYRQRKFCCFTGEKLICPALENLNTPAGQQGQECAADKDQLRV